MKGWAKSFYLSDSWRDCRESFLKYRSYLCERCSTPDNPVIACIVHHKTYLTPDNINNPNISLSWENLEALCQDCHNKEHHKRTSPRYKFTESGELVELPPIDEKK